MLTQTLSHPHDILKKNPFSILIGTSIWRSHQAFIRDDQAFEPRIVLAAVDLAITQVHAQLA